MKLKYKLLCFGLTIGGILTAPAAAHAVSFVLDYTNNQRSFTKPVEIRSITIFKDPSPGPDLKAQACTRVRNCFSLLSRISLLPSASLKQGANPSPFATNRVVSLRLTSSSPFKAKVITVPEPSMTLSMLGASAFSAGLLRNRKRKKLHDA